MTTQFSLLVGDCRERLKELPDNSIDSVVCDPPYELGFMGKSWDSTGIAYDVKVWQECLRVLKPGGYLLAFGGSRTYHRLVCAIEDAGFEIRDMISWNYSSGFPKSLDISKAIDKAAGAEREVISSYSAAKQKGSITWSGEDRTGGNGSGYGETADVTIPATPEAKLWAGWGTALKPAHEPICMARKPLSESTVANNVLRWGVGGLNIDGCRIATDDQLQKLNGSFSFSGSGGANEVGKKIEKVDAGLGRWPANFCHDGSDEVLELFPQTKPSKVGKPRGTFKKGLFANSDFNKVGQEHEDSGSAARFFYCAKANRRDRNEGLDEFEEVREHDGRKDGGVGGNNPRNRTNTPNQNHHPTVKPTDLMRYLVRLITPPDGTVLDPFTGSGSTGKAAVLEGMNFVGIELNQEYADIANARIRGATR